AQVLYHTLFLQLPNFSPVYQRRPMCPSVRHSPFSTTKRPGPTCSHPSMFLPLNNCFVFCRAPRPAALTELVAFPGKIARIDKSRKRTATFAFICTSVA